MAVSDPCSTDFTHLRDQVEGIEKTINQHLIECAEENVLTRTKMQHMEQNMDRIFKWLKYGTLSIGVILLIEIFGGRAIGDWIAKYAEVL